MLLRKNMNIVSFVVEDINTKVCCDDKIDKWGILTFRIPLQKDYRIALGMREPNIRMKGGFYQFLKSPVEYRKWKKK